MLAALGLPGCVRSGYDQGRTGLVGGDGGAVGGDGGGSAAASCTGAKRVNTTTVLRFNGNVTFALDAGPHSVGALCLSGQSRLVLCSTDTALAVEGLKSSTVLAGGGLVPKGSGTHVVRITSSGNRDLYVVADVSVAKLDLRFNTPGSAVVVNARGSKPVRVSGVFGSVRIGAQGPLEMGGITANGNVITGSAPPPPACN